MFAAFCMVKHNSYHYYLLVSAPSNYSAHPGPRLTASEFDTIFQGLEDNSLTHYSHYLSGYVGVVDVLRSLSKILQKQKTLYPHSIYVCDPVLGDNNSFYVSSESVQIYRTQLLALADILLPNIFEFECVFSSTVYLFFLYLLSI